MLSITEMLFQTDSKVTDAVCHSAYQYLLIWR